MKIKSEREETVTVWGQNLDINPKKNTPCYLDVMASDCDPFHSS